MEQITTLGIDQAKRVFALHGVDIVSTRRGAEHIGRFIRRLNPGAAFLPVHAREKRLILRRRNF